MESADDEDHEEDHDGEERMPNAKDLPCSALSDYIEERICMVIHEEYLSRGDTSETAAHVSKKFTFREVSCLDRNMNITEEARNAIRLVASHFGHDAYSSKIEYESRVFALFEKIDGVDVLIYVLYISEFGEDACEPNRNTAYISYLDSLTTCDPDFCARNLSHDLVRISRRRETA